MRKTALWLAVVALVSSGCVVRTGSGHDGDDDDARDPDGDPAGDPNDGDQGFVPPALVGEWYAGGGGTSVPYDPGSGSWGTPNGDGLVYLFRADGSYTKAFQSYETTGGCTTGFTAFEEGSVVADGATLTTRPDTGVLRYRAACAPELDSDDPIADLEDETFSWQLAPDEYDPGLTVLYLERTDGAAATFRPL